MHSLLYLMVVSFCFPFMLHDLNPSVVVSVFSLLDLQSCQRSAAECCASFGCGWLLCRVDPSSSDCSSELCSCPATEKSSSSPLSSGSTTTPRSVWPSSKFLCSLQTHRLSEVGGHWFPSLGPGLSYTFTLIRSLLLLFLLDKMTSGSPHLPEVKAAQNIKCIFLFSIPQFIYS